MPGVRVFKAHTPYPLWKLAGELIFLIYDVSGIWTVWVLYKRFRVYTNTHSWHSSPGSQGGCVEYHEAVHIEMRSGGSLSGTVVSRKPPTVVVAAVAAVAARSLP